MTRESALNEVTLAKECLRHLGEEKSVLHRAAHVLEMVAHSSVGLGEVLQDYAHQAWGQLHEVIRASQNAANGIHSADDIEVLNNAHMIIKSVKIVLERTPAAMQHNKAELLGGKERVSRSDITRLADEFAHSPDIERVLASEDSGRILVAMLMPRENAGMPVVPEADIFSEARFRH